MNKTTLTIFLVIANLTAFFALVPAFVSFHMPANDQDYRPTQPIAYSHKLHAGDLKISCFYCHFGAEQGKHAGIPAAGICMNCHKFIKSTQAAQQAEDLLAEQEQRSRNPVTSSEIQKIYDALGLGEGNERDSAKAEQPIAWVKVHNLPDFVNFDHRVHIAAKVDCTRCHGNVQAMSEVHQVKDLTMGFCVNCHRDMNTQIKPTALVSDEGEFAKSHEKYQASIDCAACHY
jgi:predicted CXXCH cytochrome family protein